MHSALQDYYPTLYEGMNDQHVTAIAIIVQDMLLFLSAILIGWYLWETRKMRQAAEKQVGETQALVRASLDQITLGQRQVDASLAQVEAAQEQLEVSQGQLAISLSEAEAQVRPVLVVAISSELAPDGTAIPRIVIRNVGKGPALNLRKYEVQGDTPIIWSGNSVPRWELEGSFVPTQHTADPAGPVDWKISRVDFTGSNRKKLHLVYQSLSGKEYASIIEFSVAGQPLRTGFEQR